MRTMKRIGPGIIIKDYTFKPHVFWSLEVGAILDTGTKDMMLFCIISQTHPNDWK